MPRLTVPVSSFFTSLIHLSTQPLTHLLTHSFTHSLTHLLFHSLTHSLSNSLIKSLTHLLTHSLSHALTHSLAHSRTHPRIGVQRHRRPCRRKPHLGDAVARPARGHVGHIAALHALQLRCSAVRAGALASAALFLVSTKRC